MTYRIIEIHEINEMQRIQRYCLSLFFLSTSKVLSLQTIIINSFFILLIILIYILTYFQEINKRPSLQRGVLFCTFVLTTKRDGFSVETV